MVRPTDWHVLDMSRDPTPGDPSDVRTLAWQVGRVAEDAEQAERAVRGLAGDGAVLSWIGASAEVFRGALKDFPSQLGKLADSYGQAELALSRYGTDLDDAQEQAGRALQQGRAAQSEIASLSTQLSGASARASDAGSTADRLTRPVPAGAEPPDPEQVRAATRNAQTAQARVGALQDSLGGARGRLEAAKRLAQDAKALRERAADVAGGRLHDASDAGIKPNSWWDDFKSAVAKVWHVTIAIAKVAVAVLGVIALIIGGPLAWVVLGLALLLLADALRKLANGEGSWWEVGFALLGCIPGTKGLTTLTELRAAFAAGGTFAALAHVGSAGLTSLRAMTTALRAGGGRLATRLTTLARAGLSFGSDARLGARTLPQTGRLGRLLVGYDRLAGLSREEFLARFHPDGDWAWPGNRGFDGPAEVRTLQPGEVLDRFGNARGRYLSPDGTPYPHRAIPPSNLDPLKPHLDLHRYEVVKPFDVHDGAIAPAFGQPGGGTQQLVDGALLGLDLPPGTRVNVEWLVQHGYLAPLPVR